MSDRIIAAVGVAFLVYVLARLFNSSQRRPRLPGPRGWPLLGYVRAIESPPWITYRQWSDEYRKPDSRHCFALLYRADTRDDSGSDILGYHILGTRVVIANSLKVAAELLDTRSAIYSDRYAFCGPLLAGICL